MVPEEAGLPSGPLRSRIHRQNLGSKIPLLCDPVVLWENMGTTGARPIRYSFNASLAAFPGVEI